ncbi:MAG: NAD-dependent epimerase/dehydratase family protein, partial [Gammaproteobacteria bacterium]|nr:NAD-dependent epimerase/dehydratase family protein [Gammaproteobacteria bacterium]
MRILVTGASGFVGRALCLKLAAEGLRVRAALRRAAATPDRCERVLIGDVGPDTDWSAALAGVDTVVHLAARVHMMDDTANDPLEAFRHVNVLGSERLAGAAARAGVRRLVFVSSIKAMGERTAPDRPFSEVDTPRPADPYGRSKWEAEQSLAAIAARTDIELAIVRPPLVYGPAVRANFLSLMELIALGLPLPLGQLENRRSLVYLHNLCDALYRCTVDPRASGQLFLVADDKALSTPELIRDMARALEVRPRLLAIPPAVLRLAGAVTGRSAA